MAVASSRPNKAPAASAVKVAGNSTAVSPRMNLPLTSASMTALPKIQNLLLVKNIPVFPIHKIEAVTSAVPAVKTSSSPAAQMVSKPNVKTVLGMTPETVAPEARSAISSTAAKLPPRIPVSVNAIGTIVPMAVFLKTQTEILFVHAPPPLLPVGLLGSILPLLPVSLPRPLTPPLLPLSLPWSLPPPLPLAQRSPTRTHVVMAPVDVLGMVVPTPVIPLAQTNIPSVLASITAAITKENLVVTS